MQTVDPSFFPSLKGRHALGKNDGSTVCITAPERCFGHAENIARRSSVNVRKPQRLVQSSRRGSGVPAANTEFDASASTSERENPARRDALAVIGLRALRLDVDAPCDVPGLPGTSSGAVPRAVDSVLLPASRVCLSASRSSTESTPATTPAPIRQALTTRRGAKTPADRRGSQCPWNCSLPADRAARFVACFCAARTVCRGLPG